MEGKALIPSCPYAFGFRKELLLEKRVLSRAASPTPVYPRDIQQPLLLDLVRLNRASHNWTHQKKDHADRALKDQQYLS
jgi:hypothetical protein